jgi:hypothetical protein
VSRHAEGNSGAGFAAEPTVVYVGDDDPVARIAAFAAYLRDHASRAELVDTALVLAAHLDAFAGGCRRLLVVPPLSALTAAADLDRWGREVLPQFTPRH